MSVATEFQTYPCGVEAQGVPSLQSPPQSFRRTLVGLKLRAPVVVQKLLEFQTYPCGVEART